VPDRDVHRRRPMRSTRRCPTRNADPDPERTPPRSEHVLEAGPGLERSGRVGTDAGKPQVEGAEPDLRRLAGDVDSA
jgi:hypothetical protein